MNKLTVFEDLPIEIFLEILNYFHPIDLFAILHFADLHVRIANYLTNHVDQIISFSID